MRPISISRRPRVAAALAATTIVAVLAGCGGGSEVTVTSPEPASTVPAATTATTSSADLGAIKAYLLSQTGKLTDFTGEFKADATRYFELATAAGFDYEALWADQAAEVGPLLEKMKSDWIAGNPLYERMEGIVAGVSLAVQNLGERHHATNSSSISFYFLGMAIALLALATTGCDQPADSGASDMDNLANQLDQNKQAQAAADAAAAAAQAKAAEEAAGAEQAAQKSGR